MNPRNSQGECRAEYEAMVYPGAMEALIRPIGGRQARIRGPRVDRSADAIRRAANHLRRYLVANRLVLFCTLTFREPVMARGGCQHPLAQLHSYLRQRAFGGARYPWARVIEEHPGGHGFHVHGLFPFVEPSLVKRYWARWGFADVRRLLGVEEVRAVAEYASKDFAKTPPGVHRYEVAQGFLPEKQTLRAARPDELEASVVDIMGGNPSLVWPAWDEFSGPHPVRILRWTKAAPDPNV